MKFRKVATIIFAIVCVGAVASSARAQKTKPASSNGGTSQPGAEPLSKKRLLKLLTLNDSSQPELIQIVGQKGVDFKPTPSDERELHDAGASDELIVAVRANYRDGTSSSAPTQESGGAVVSTADAPPNSETGTTPNSQAAEPPAQAAPNTTAAPPAAKKKSFLDKLNQTIDKANAARASQHASAQTPAATQTAPPAQPPAAPAEPTNTEPPPTETTGTAQDATPVTNATAPAPREPDTITSSGKVIHHTGHPKAMPDAKPAPETTTATPPVNTTQQDETLPNGKVIHHTGHPKAPVNTTQDETLPNGKVIHHTGHPKATPDTEPAPETTSATVPETMSVPGIMASPNNIALVHGKGTGQTTLTWDGGKAHRAAEVWVKVDDADETKVVGSGTGTLQVAVVPGKTYVYTLKDKSGVLATVTVQFHR